MAGDIAIALDKLMPAARYGGSLTANDRAAYDALVWEDDRPKPTWAQIEAAGAEVAKEGLLAYLSAWRRKAQTAGVVWDGHEAGTDRDSRAAVMQAISAIDMGVMSSPITWKFENDFAELTRDQLVSLAEAMAAHVQACFDLQAQLTADIESGAITTTQQIDEADWPETRGQNE